MREISNENGIFDLCLKFWEGNVEFDFEPNDRSRLSEESDDWGGVEGVIIGVIDAAWSRMSENFKKNVFYAEILMFFHSRQKVPRLIAENYFSEKKRTMEIPPKIPNFRTP